MSESYSHQSVLLNEVTGLLNIKEDGVYLDLTLGGGGHAKEILKRLKGGILIGLDQDEDAIKASQESLKDYPNFISVKSNFINIDNILKELKISKVDGVVMDLGVSSYQFDNPKRGFSYREEAKLDMRMDKDNPLTAEIIVNTYPIEKLTKIFYEYGEEHYSKEIAKNICKEREIKPIETTLELVDIIKRSKPQKELKKIGHPAKQVFQALRIEVNNELYVLEKTLQKVLPMLNKGGRLAVISFQSLEDRIVKRVFKENSETIGDRLEGPTPKKEINYKLITKKVITPSQEELDKNPRSRSAKLRVIERI